ncbi:inositol monophosphatase family protein [Sciscionella sediminilitoris]|uniref:inositol monophosphatase family protein n=1 Tax=Sciscionella sediminilitoris TaxID=1445613 RepID=UPI0004DF32B5|nr:inositol monophosphatase family protein [Sciscionella sp. SE31]
MADSRTPDAGELRSVAVTVAGAAAELVAGMRSGPLRFGGGVDSKSNEVDVVTEADTAAERLVRERLAALRPGEPVLGEEEGGNLDEAEAVSWVIDPIDGTVNYLYGWPMYTVSLAAQCGGEVLAGAVVDVAGGRVFSAAKGHGATLSLPGEEPLTLGLTGPDRLAVSLVATGFGYDPAKRVRQAKALTELIGRVRDFRRGGSAAFDLCAVAAGWVDAFYERGLNRWDWAAGALIAREAGAVVRLPEHKEELLFAAAPGIAGELHDALVDAGV